MLKFHTYKHCQYNTLSNVNIIKIFDSYSSCLSQTSEKATVSDCIVGKPPVIK